MIMLLFTIAKACWLKEMLNLDLIQSSNFSLFSLFIFNSQLYPKMAHLANKLAAFIIHRELPRNHYFSSFHKMFCIVLNIFVDSQDSRCVCRIFQEMSAFLILVFILEWHFLFLLNWIHLRIILRSLNFLNY